MTDKRKDIDQLFARARTEPPVVAFDETRARVEGHLRGGSHEINESNTTRNIIMITTGIGVLAAALIGFLSWSTNDAATQASQATKAATGVRTIAPGVKGEVHGRSLNPDRTVYDGSAELQGRTGKELTDASMRRKAQEGAEAFDSSDLDGRALVPVATAKDTAITFSSVALDSTPDQVIVRYTLGLQRMISLVLYDVKGMRVRAFDEPTLRNIGEYSHTVNLEGVPPGIYFLTISTGKRKEQAVHKITLSLPANLDSRAFVDSSANQDSPVSGNLQITLD